MTFGSYGTGKLQLYSPAGIAVTSDGNIYVSDWGNNMIKVFNSSGAYLAGWGNSFGNPGSGPGEFAYPEGLALDAAGNLYVADHDNQRIQIFGH